MFALIGEATLISVSIKLLYLHMLTFFRIKVFYFNFLCMYQ
jgi:hypothetical protein